MVDYKQIIRLGEQQKKKVGGYRHPRSRSRIPLKVSARQYAAQLLQERLTARDLELARALIGVGMLTRHQIQRMLFADNAKLASNRLVKLYHYHFLDRSSYWLADMGDEGFEPCYIYTIGATGLEAIALQMGISQPGSIPDRALHTVAGRPLLAARFTSKRDVYPAAVGRAGEGL